MAGTVGFLALIQCGERPERYSDPSRFDTIPSQPSKMPPKSTSPPTRLIPSIREQAESSAAPLSQNPIAVLHEPLSVRRVGLPGTARALGRVGRIYVRYGTRRLGPVDALGVGIKKAQIFQIVVDQVSLRWSLVGNERHLVNLFEPADRRCLAALTDCDGL